jgi:hypothetical protein
MPASTLTTVDVSQALASVLTGIDGLRVYAHVADIARVPCAVVQLPTIDYADPSGGFCGAVWSFPLLIVTARNQDLEAQQRLSTFVSQIAQALWDAEVDGLQSIEPQLAVPTTVQLSGQDLPAYTLRVLVRA